MAALEGDLPSSFRLSSSTSRALAYFSPSASRAASSAATRTALRSAASVCCRLPIRAFLLLLRFPFSLAAPLSLEFPLTLRLPAACPHELLHTVPAAVDSARSSTRPIASSASDRGARSPPATGSPLFSGRICPPCIRRDSRSVDPGTRGAATPPSRPRSFASSGSGLRD